ncbi:MAG: Type-F conjugative transfer system pilin assembly protein [Chromatiaceae bacterium]|nr:Type-F conjugative transfer system pilin assembly protein [Chromatiaceae bacterium]
MRCSDCPRPTVAAILLGLAACACANDPERADLRAIRDQSGAIEQAAATAPHPDWLSEHPRSGAAQAGRALGRAQRQRLVEQIAPQVFPASGAAATPEDVVTILVSRSLGSAALRDIFETGAAPGVRIVFRGVAQGERLMDFIQGIHAQLQGIEPVPSVELDPTPFREAGADAVPLMILSGPDGEIARVAGLTDPAWLRDQVAAGRVGDLGVRGPVAAIAEPDMIEEIERRVAALDLDKLREQAITSYWTQARFEYLETAHEVRERVIDPTVAAKSDVTLPDGTTLVRAGASANPLDHLPFTRRLVVFDPTEPGQVRQARELGEAPGSPPLYLATRFDRDAGWDGFRAVEDTLDEPVYLLTPDVRERFALERVPATVEASGRTFLVREYPPERP